MRALQYDAYGGPERLQLRDVNDVQASTGPVVRVVCAALNPKDALFRKGKFKLLSGRRFPKFVGLDFAGVVEIAAPGFTVGQRVFGMLQEFTFARGTLAERCAPRAEEVCALPAEVDDADAAAVPLVGLTALQALRDVAGLQAGQSVLINGASGGVGTVAVQLARLLQAGQVTTVSSEAMTPLCVQLGAHEALDYSRRDEALRSGRFDVVFDVFGNLSFAQARAALKPRGTFVSTVPSPGRVLRDVLLRFGAQRERLVAVAPNRADLTQLAVWLKQRQLRAIIDGRFPLDAYAQAFARLESKKTHGKLIIDVGPPAAL